ncbi:Lrp/AsnC family transcriptional regulator [Nesterenkonia natronophila]|uniref:Lrp/AsnC family transcriptional regulator n=1 Tax=Nesterenkonia natronophila TaxID=2174932 RepID=A0A3A4F7K9_9MICC|nr:Lrp/AsnC family transcriptional regulator [Nesterenkonia natronophila]RJN32480.1 Lrp/AsnC family transcriptional regulator [Nesterenkonia natronophila]
MPPKRTRAPKKLQQEHELDHIDRRLLELLRNDARMTNQALSENLGVAPSTCLARVKALQQAGVIRRFTVEVDPRALGRGIEALISVRLRPGARQQMAAFGETLKNVPEVTQYFFVGGMDDFLIHVTARDTDHIRQFVLEHLSADPVVATTHTSLVFEHVSGLASL